MFPLSYHFNLTENKKRKKGKRIVNKWFWHLQLILLIKTVCREDSYHSVVSCAAVVLTPMEPTVEMKKREELKFPEPSKQ